MIIGTAVLGDGIVRAAASVGSIVAVGIVVVILVRCNLHYEVSRRPHSLNLSSGCLMECYEDLRPRQHIGQRGDYWVLYNYILAKRQFRSLESITYTTHADFTFLDNLEPLLSRWRGPISLALYSPGTDFNATLKAIRYLRKCISGSVSDLVTFHLYFPRQHMPNAVPKGSSLLKIEYNCSLPPPWTDSNCTYRARNKLAYPINVGRNIAKEMATTHFILASDIELYPSPGVIGNFLDMMRHKDPPLHRPNPKVFPMPVFELEANASLPNDKTELVSMLANGTAFMFHEQICLACHLIPRYKEWLEAPGRAGDGLRVFTNGKRTGAFRNWEPFYFGTKDEPPFDERLSWEGQSNKFTQAYTLCVLDYEFHVLDNAFLVHKPGIKTFIDPTRHAQIQENAELIRRTIEPELARLYGRRKGCQAAYG